MPRLARESCVQRRIELLQWQREQHYASLRTESFTPLQIARERSKGLGNGRYLGELMNLGYQASLARNSKVGLTEDLMRYLNFGKEELFIEICKEAYSIFQTDMNKFIATSIRNISRFMPSTKKMARGKFSGRVQLFSKKIFAQMIMKEVPEDSRAELKIMLYKPERYRVTIWLIMSFIRNNPGWLFQQEI